MTGWSTWPADQGDEADLARLEQEAFGDRSWGAQNLEGSFATPGVAVLFGGHRGAPPLGFAIWRDIGMEAELLSIGVMPKVRENALGAALLVAVIGDAGQAGAQKLFLEVDAGNQAALALYRKSGFLEIGRRRAYYRDGADALTMQLKL